MRKLFVFLLVILGSCSDKVKQVDKIWIRDTKSNVFELTENQEIKDFIKILEAKTAIERVPLRNRGRIDIILTNNDSVQSTWLFCNTIDYGIILVNEADVSKNYKNHALDSFFLKFKEEHINFGYW